jgi:hypothetical protein
MGKRKKSANWYVAATHYLTSGFVAPFLIFLVSSFTIIPLASNFNSTILNVIVYAIIFIISIWLGIMHSSRYLRNAYIITEKSKDKIVNLSTIYFVIFSGGFSALAAGPFSLIFFALLAFIFYKLSYKYINANEKEEISQVN